MSVSPGNSRNLTPLDESSSGFISATPSDSSSELEVSIFSEPEEHAAKSKNTNRMAFFISTFYRLCLLNSAP